MKMTERDIQNIENMVINEVLFRHPIEASLFKNDREVFEEPQVFRNYTQLISALKKLKGFEFGNALNGMINFRKTGNENDYYHLQLERYESIEFAKEIRI